jgi:hypothetical protein
MPLNLFRVKHMLPAKVHSFDRLRWNAQTSDSIALLVKSGHEPSEDEPSEACVGIAE